MKKIKKENKFEFNIELEECKIYNQGGSKRCWLFGVLNLIKNNMAHNLSQNVLEFELSPNYLNFFDKLEKANHAYQTVIDSEIDESFLLCDYENHPVLIGYFRDPVGIKDMTKAQSLETFDCRARHIMTVRGVHLVNNKPIRWKIEDSAGEENRINGYYVMNNNYFEKCVFYALINKKFLSNKVLKVLQEPAILYGFEGSEL